MIPIKQQSGFALLITILVLSVIVAVTLGIVELSLKQLKLSVDSTDSEIAFHAANAGLECARYTRRKESNDVETGGTVTFDCFANSGNTNPVSVAGMYISPPLDSNRLLYRYKRDITWGTAPNERCSSIDILGMVANSSFTIGNGTGAQSLKNYVNGYETDSKTCEAGERCTIMSVIGYSSACGATSTPGVLRREILLEL